MKVTPTRFVDRVVDLLTMSDSFKGYIADTEAKLFLDWDLEKRLFQKALKYKKWKDYVIKNSKINGR
jgi:hypothetical protein